MDEASRAGDREEKSGQLEKALELIQGLDSKMNDIESRVRKIESDDMCTVAFRSINEAIASEDGSKEETLSLLAEGFKSPEKSGKHKRDKGII